MTIQQRYLTAALALLVVALAASLVSERAVIAQVKASLVKDADNAARQPYTTSCYKGEGGICSTPAVPAGKRFVIEMVESTTNFANWGGVIGFVQIQVNNRIHYIEALAPPGFVLSRQVRYYANPSSTISAVNYAPSGFFVESGISILFSGYLVDLP